MMALVVLASSSVGMAGEGYMRMPAGTQLPVRMIDKLSSENASIGDRFHGTLAAPVVVNGRTVFSKGAEVTGEVVNVERSGRLSNPGVLELTLRTVQAHGRNYPVATEAFLVKGRSHAKNNVTKIGGGAAAGALIGALAGGGKGAAIGTAVGATAGTGAAAATGRRPAEVESEAVLVWVAGDPQARPAVQAQSSAPPSPEGYVAERAPREYPRARLEYTEEEAPVPMEFSLRERQIIGQCLVDERSGLPPGLAKRDRLPPGLERHLERNGTLPPGLQKRAQPLPEVCVARLPRLPRAWTRVVLGGRIILLDPRERVVDLFWLEGN
jgi:hypothetical protein